ncbi:helix-turn-helix domain-containing protein, partial [Pseudomonas aeruginosa]|uniref:helix-turn-helix domain-containing protein n=3 Tax=Pseudomonas aeruginosa TaxID=287 RepID=UPI0024BE2FF7
ARRPWRLAASGGLPWAGLQLRLMTLGATLGLRAAAGEPKAQLAREFNISRQTLYQHFRTNE